MKKPKYHICKTCHLQIPIADWEAHKKMEADQLDMFPEMPRIEKEPRRRQRSKRQSEGLA